MTGTAGVALIPLLASSAILIAGAIDDLRTRKFHNWLFLACTALGIAVTLFVGGFSGLAIGVLGFLAGFAILLPLVLLNIVGAGDMKLMAAFGLLAGWGAVVEVAFFALVWGSVFGVARAVVSGHAKTLFNNLLAIVAMKEREKLELQKIPFTIAILFGWMTHLVRSGVFL